MSKRLEHSHNIEFVEMNHHNNSYPKTKIIIINLLFFVNNVICDELDRDKKNVLHESNMAILLSPYQSTMDRETHNNNQYCKQPNRRAVRTFKSFLNLLLTGTKNTLLALVKSTIVFVI